MIVKYVELICSLASMGDKNTTALKNAVKKHRDAVSVVISTCKRIQQSGSYDYVTSNFLLK